MSDESKKILPIDYTHREFQSIRDDLLQIAERYYPDTFQDFSEASFGSLMLDAVAYVGDQLSFYLDYNVNEAFLDTAYGLDNIIRHGRILGYKNTGPPSIYGEVALYIMIPSNTSGLGPNEGYIPILKRGSTFSSQNGLGFVLTENIDFNSPANPVVVAKVDESTGAPTHFAIKAYGNVVSGRYGSQSITVGAFQRFRRVKFASRPIAEVISVFDTEGQEYFEVDYLSQDMVYKEMPNDNYKKDNVPSILKPMLVSRKFIVVRDRTGTYLQFGSGDEALSNVVANPQNVAIDTFGKTYVTDTTFDPSRLSRNTSYGIVPANTTLTITYRVNNPVTSNVSVGSLRSVSDAFLEFEDRDKLVTSTIDSLRASVEVNNETPLIGSVRAISPQEVKERIFDTFPTQNRAVTQADYENIALRMPGKFGSIKKVSIQKDADSMKRNLNMYVISEDKFGKLIKTNNAIKSNLKTWMNQYRMINDTIDILDPYVINLGVEFVIKVLPTADRNSALSSAIGVITDKFAKNYFIAQQFNMSDIYSELKRITTILDVVKVRLVNKSGGQYSYVNFSIEENLSPEGDYLMCPKNAIFEIKFPRVDIKGKVR